LANGAGVEIIPYTDWYLEDGTFDFRRVLSRFREKVAEACSRGYSGLRCTGDAGWLGTRGRKRLHEYECALNRTLADHNASVLCTYPLAACSAADVLDASRIHGRTFSLRTGEPKILDAPDSWRTADLRAGLNQQLEDRVIIRTRALQAANADLIQEIAERRQVEAELRTEKEVLQQIFDHIPVMINFLDSRGRILLVNREWESTLGWTLDEIKANNLNILAECYPDPGDQEAVLEFVLNSHGEWKEFKTRIRDGRAIDTNWAVVRLSDGRVLGIGKDVTARKESERQLEATAVRLRALSASIEAAREEERSRLARLIHDELGSALTSLKWELGAVDDALSQSPDSDESKAARRKITNIMDLANTAIETVRGVASTLRPSILDDLGLIEAIEWQAQQFETRTGIICKRECFGEDLRFTRDQSTALFRIFQESLTNILRHANATRVEVRMSRQAEAFILKIEDNGKGIGPAEKSGLGILGMKERVRLLGGSIDIHGIEGKGTTIIARIPITMQGADHEANPDC
jgi:PAS domain S-box-containing protein